MKKKHTEKAYIRLL